MLLYKSCMRSGHSAHKLLHLHTQSLNVKKKINWSLMATHSHLCVTRHLEGNGNGAGIHTIARIGKIFWKYFRKFIPKMFMILWYLNGLLFCWILWIYFLLIPYWVSNFPSHFVAPFYSPFLIVPFFKLMKKWNFCINILYGIRWSLT